MTACEIEEVADWLIDGARSAPQPVQVLAQLSERLVACGIPLWRVAVFVRTLHPQVMGRRFIWRPGTGVEVSEAPFELLESADFLENPIAHVYATGQALRRKLADPDCAVDFPVLSELRAEGITDYLALPLVFTDGAIHAVTCTTRQAGGFTDAQIAGIEAIITPLARVAEIRALRRMASTLLDTYVGHDAGERILAGHIRRGDIEEIHAAIWLSDMRGFTALADSLPPSVLIDLLNRYFDCQVPVILEHGAEVLKFMGDGLLAIFTIAGDETEVCERALAAARRAQANVATLSDAAMPGLRFGLALHVGEVLYGNIGSGNRLDFTCIGPAVNCAARIEKLTSQLGRAILASGEFARNCAGEFTPLGGFRLAGFSAPQLVFGLEDSAQRQ
ncbi:MAG: adenylate/guanylate cyclase domain-containing protein [Alphaproteobacteria bacterium]|nr:MAG: adenylate/guanylate cyclase domain-containing protein [Alphaproteobacteria bacterium]